MSKVLLKGGRFSRKDAFFFGRGGLRRPEFDSRTDVLRKYEVHGTGEGRTLFEGWMLYDVPSAPPGQTF